jgi:hypothetical protein
MEEIFHLAETHGWIDDFGRWNFKNDDALLEFVHAIVRTHTPEDIKKIERKWDVKPSFYDDVGRLLKSGKGFYDDGTPIDYKEIQLKTESVSEDVFECVEVRIPRPPKREWVSLTDTEMCECYNSKSVGYAIEAKLKEKNTWNP